MTWYLGGGALTSCPPSFGVVVIAVVAESCGDDLDDRPEDEHPAERVHRVDPVGDDLHVDLQPRVPARRTVLLARPRNVGAAVVVAARLGPGAAEHDELAHACLGAVLGVDVATGDRQAGHLGVLVEVALVGGLRRLGGDLVLQQVVLERGERRGLAGAQLRAQVVLRVEEDLPVGLPDPVVAHPGPPGLEPGLGPRPDRPPGWPRWAGPGRSPGRAGSGAGRAGWRRWPREPARWCRSGPCPRR